MLVRKYLIPLMSVAGIALAVQAPEELGRHQVVQPRPLQLAQRLAHQRLAAAAGVDLGVVEEVDAGVVGGGHHLARRRSVDLVVVGHPGPEGENADTQAGTAETTVLHGGEGYSSPAA